jgi:hypothetical protein
LGIDLPGVPDDHTYSYLIGFSELPHGPNHLTDSVFIAETVELSRPLEKILIRLVDTE